MNLLKSIFVVLSLLICANAIAVDIIAHRGASGVLPEHTLVSVAYAHAAGADYIEQDVVLTKDDIPIVMHDIYLEQTTNVADIFPKRKREDGHFYAIDFTVQEIQYLEVHERVAPGTNKPIFPNRFPLQMTQFRVPTLEQEIKLIQGLNHSTRLDVGLYVELKNPQWHRDNGKNLATHTLGLLAQYGYENADDNAFIQSFDAKELKLIFTQQLTNLKLIQLIGENDWNLAETDFDAMKTSEGITEVATYAAGIGPWWKQLLMLSDDKIITTDLTRFAHQHKLLVHPYTFRIEEVPAKAHDYEHLLKVIVQTLQVDAIFTDNPLRTAKFVSRSVILNDFKHEPKAGKR
ncbi:glycerophosphodiester phosphodiesterase [Echinimonas agarilytica]|uniref:glycerophosphodiester phosphodiesterase n=1 Tax=Echinimonas agarilytica TaxID=1215918 RepID=A0AA42B7M5_9GAMM|nr:glycerophosphodiester phosphodiesterase [Echinimonas agarilytica]MCM2680335.1 glycerophosphodiester phosphodiesterase [Echinimonas agarilytica]